jgi:phosphopantetheinyl transferase
VPLIFFEEISEYKVGVWLNSEALSYFEANLNLFPEEINEIQNLSGKKLEEWYSSRNLLHLLSGKTNRVPCVKDDNGKPYLIGYNQFVSLSHSHECTAAIISTYHCGIDIQKKSEKIAKIQSKFISEREKNEHIEMDMLDMHIMWGSKESLFKLYGKGGVDFKKHLYISPFTKEQKKCIGEIRIDNYHLTTQLYFYEIQEYILVHTGENFRDKK